MDVGSKIISDEFMIVCTVIVELVRVELVRVELTAATGTLSFSCLPPPIKIMRVMRSAMKHVTIMGPMKQMFR